MGLYEDTVLGTDILFYAGTFVLRCLRACQKHASFGVGCPFKKRGMIVRLVSLESPFSGDVPRNIDYARLCVRDCLLRDEAPIASHLLYTQPNILDDKKPKERDLGMFAGFCWNLFAKATVVYVDYGISHGMTVGIHRAEFEERPVEYRTLFKTDQEKFAWESTRTGGAE